MLIIVASRFAQRQLWHKKSGRTVLKKSQIFQLSRLLARLVTRHSYGYLNWLTPLVVSDYITDAGWVCIASIAVAVAWSSIIPKRSSDYCSSYEWPYPSAAIAAMTAVVTSTTVSTSCHHWRVKYQQQRYCN